MAGPQIEQAIHYAGFGKEMCGSGDFEDFQEGFKKGFNMVFEPAAKHLLHPLANATGAVPISMALSSLGYGRTPHDHGHIVGQLGRIHRMKGGAFWDDFKKGFNMVFEPSAKYVLKPLAAATGNVPVVAGLSALGYGKKCEKCGMEKCECKVGGAILGNPDPYPVKGNSARVAGRGKSGGGKDPIPLKPFEFDEKEKLEPTRSIERLTPGVYRLKTVDGQQVVFMKYKEGKTEKYIDQSSGDIVTKSQFPKDRNVDAIYEIDTSGMVAPQDAAAAGPSGRGRGRPRKMKGGALTGPNGDLLAMPSPALKNGVPPRGQLRGSYGGAKPKKESGSAKPREMKMGMKKMEGGDGRKKRAEIVKRVMKEKGLKMIEASKYVKEHHLY